MAGITTLVSGRYSDKLKESEPIVVLGYVIMAVGFWGYMLVNSLWSFLVIQVIVGLGEAIYAPAFDSSYSRCLNGHKSASQWGAWEAVNYFTTAFGAITGGLLVTLFGFNIMFAIMGLLCFVSAIYVSRLPKWAL